MAAVMHELVGGESTLPVEVLTECVRSMEEGRFPGLEDVDRITAAQIASAHHDGGDGDGGGENPKEMEARRKMAGTLL